MARVLRLAVPLALLALVIPAEAVEDKVVLALNKPRPEGTDAAVVTKQELTDGTTARFSGFFAREYNNHRGEQNYVSNEYFDAFYQFGSGSVPEPHNELFGGPTGSDSGSFQWMVDHLSGERPPYDPNHVYNVTLDFAAQPNPWRFEFRGLTDPGAGGDPTTTEFGQIEIVLDIPGIDATAKFSFKTRELPDSRPRNVIALQAQASGRVEFRNLDTADKRPTGRGHGKVAIAVEAARGPDSLTVLDIKGPANFFDGRGGRVLSVPLRVRRSGLRGCKDGSRGQLSLSDRFARDEEHAANLAWCGRRWAWDRLPGDAFSVFVGEPR